MTESKPFGSYELLGRISAGGMAEVFRAKDKRGNLVALKKILPQVAQDDEFIEMFEDEAAIARQLEHPHIARMLDFGRVDQTYYIAFEYVHGKDLRMIFNSCVRLGQPANIPFLVYVFTRIGEGLSYAHARRDANGQPVSIVHRDVSPQNIVVSTSGDVKLIDFGIAKAAGKLSRTQVGTIKGKFGYMSPEQVKGLPIDASTDVFSMGICMWELLTLKRLFHADNELLVLQKIKTLKVLPPSQHNPAVPAELDRIVLKALAKDMNERYRAAKDLYKDLNQFSATHQVAATRDEIAETMRQLFPEMASPDGSRNDRNMPIPLVGASIRFGSALPQNGEIRRQETYKMSAENKGGSDLDIFEGLGKKSVPQQRASTAPPAPPNSSMRTPVAAPVTRQDGPPSPGQPMTPAARELGKKTLMGMHAPPGMAPGPTPGSSPPPSQRPSQSNMPTAPLSTRSSSSSSMPAVRQPTSDAPPARGSLPPIVAPPAKPTPPPASTRPAPYAYTQDSGAKGGPLAAGAAAPVKGGGLEMDWDDEDEATHLFDKKSDEPATRPGDQDRPSQRLPSTSTTPSPSRPAPSQSQSPPSVSRVSAPPPVPPSVRMPAASASSPPPSVRVPSAAPAPSQRPSGSIPIVAPPPPPPPPMTAPGGFGSMGNLTGGSQPPPSASLSAQFARTAPASGSMGPSSGPLSNPIPPPPGMMSPNSQRPYPPPGFPAPPGVASPGMQPLGAQQGSLPPPQHYGSMPPPSQQHYGSMPPQQHGSMPPPYGSQPPHGMAPQTHTTPMQMPEQRPQYHSQPPHAQSRMEATQMVRAPSTSKAPLFIGLGLGVAGLAVAGILLFALPHSAAKLGVTVVDSKGMPVSHAEVSVDGKKACDTSPCTVDSVGAGGHTVRVVAPGYDPAERAVTTEARKDSSIELMVTSSGSGSKAGTGLKVAGSQPGVKLSIDGKDIGPL
ncbi:MAG: serine/threonine protein kinase, partial [Myxococcaceae bacterium]|nr:serine/threonine protein kinase [Myxococcaceae bacterium]